MTPAEYDNMRGYLREIRRTVAAAIVADSMGNARVTLVETLDDVERAQAYVEGVRPADARPTGPT